MHTYIHSTMPYLYFFEVTSIRTYLSFLRSYFKYFLRNSFGVTSLLLTYLLDFDLGYRKYQLHCFRYIYYDCLVCCCIMSVFIYLLFQHLVLHLFIHYFATSRLVTYLIWVSNIHDNKIAANKCDSKLVFEITIRIAFGNIGNT